MEPGSRDRTGSTSSVKRRREMLSKSTSSSSSENDNMDVDQPELPASVEDLRETLEEFLFKETNKVSKTAALFVLRIWRKMEKLCYDKMVEKVEAVTEVKVQKRMLKTQDTTQKKMTYSQAAASHMPKVGKRTVVPRDAEKVVIVYQKDETKIDSEETKKALKEVITPKDMGLQIRSLRKVQKVSSWNLELDRGHKKSEKYPVRLKN